MNLEEGRKLIDDLDSEILTLLNRRATLSRRIGRIKMRAGMPIVDRQREEIVLRRIIRENAGEIDDRALTCIYREILNESRRIQSIVVGEVVVTGDVRT